MFSLFVYWIFTWLSRTTLLYALFVISAAAYMRQLMNFVLATFDTGDAGPFVWAFFALMGAGVFVLLFRSRTGRQRISPVRLLLPALIFSIGLMTAARLELAAERVHLVFFGILGFLAARDTAREGLALPGAWLFCLLFCVLVAALDEFFQYFLPYRVGDPRDVLFGALGALWGLALHTGASYGSTAVDG